VTGRRWPSYPQWRDSSLFLTGLGLIVYEAVFRSGPERPTLLLLYAAMCGLPAFLKADEKRADGSANESPPPPKERIS
jgi:hypothetical protein